jgi:hypothetical protein
MYGMKTSNIPVKKFISQSAGGKIMLTLFSDSQGSVLDCYQESSRMVNGAYYNEMLIDKLNLVIQSSKCQGQLSMYCGFA